MYAQKSKAQPIIITSDQACWITESKAQPIIMPNQGAHVVQIQQPNVEQSRIESCILAFSHNLQIEIQRHSLNPEQEAPHLAPIIKELELRLGGAQRIKAVFAAYVAVNALWMDIQQISEGKKSVFFSAVEQLRKAPPSVTRPKCSTQLRLNLMTGH